MKIEDKAYFAPQKPVPKYKVGDFVKTQGKNWGEIIEVEVRKGHYDDFHVTYVVKLKDSRDEVAYDEKELTKIDATRPEYSPYRPTGRQGIY